jgi:hypothetical protein
MPRPPDLEARIAAALPPIDTRARRRAADQEWELTLLDRLDPDERALLIRLAHPEFDDAIERGDDEAVVGGAPINPSLHVTIHEIVAAQVIDGDPPEAFETAQRLLALGRDPHEVLHMLGSAMVPQLWAATHAAQAYSRIEHVKALAALPGSWDEQADARP